MPTKRDQLTIYPSKAARTIVGGNSPGCNMAIECWAQTMRQTEDTIDLSRAEWNFLAEAISFTHKTVDERWAAGLLCERAREGAQIQHLGKHWFPEADAVERLLEKLSVMDYVQVQYVLLAVSHFWAKREIDPLHDDWWTVSWWLSASRSG